MKNLKMLFTAVVALVAGAFVSCTNEFQPGEVPSGPQVCFDANTPAVAAIAVDGEGDKTFDIVLNRVVTTGTLEVEVLSDCGDFANCFEIPEKATFADGEESAKLTVKVNIDNMEDGKVYPVEFLIPDSKITTPYGFDKITVDFKLNPWVILNPKKKAKVRVGDALTGLWKDYIDPNLEIEVYAYEHKLQKGLYMVENPWEEIITTCMESGDEFAQAELANITFTGANLIFDCADPTKVSLPLQAVATHTEYGNLTLVSKYPEDATLAGEMADSVVTFPKGALTLNAKRSSGNSVNGNINNLFRIIMPGGLVTDYSLAFAYDGMEVAVGSTEATAKFSFKYGDDVTGIQYLLANGNIERESEAAVAALLAGTDSNIVNVQDFNKGGKEIVVKTNIPAGLYTMIAAPKNLTGTLVEKSLIIKSFYFSGLGQLPDHACVADAWVKKVSEHDATLAVSHPDYANYVCHIQGQELKDVWMVVEQTRFLPATDKDLVAYVKENGTNLIDKMGVINSAEGWTEVMSAWENIDYSILVYAVNDYDQGKFIKLTHKTDDIAAYTGDVVLGKYTLACEKQKSYNTFTLKHRASSTTEFFVEDFCYEDGNQWYATYDATAGTLTVSGERRGHEGATSFTKQLGVINDKETGLDFGYAFYSIAEAKTQDTDETEEIVVTVKGTDPFVFTVDPQTKKLSGVQKQKQLIMHLLDLETGSISEAKRLLNYFNFANNGTVLTPYVEGEATTASHNSSAVPFSSVTSLQNNCRKNFVKDISGTAQFRSVKAEIVR